MREGELVREVDGPTSHVGELVHEVENQAVSVTSESEVGRPARRYLCWICGDRPFNARRQLVDHIKVEVEAVKLI